MKADIPIIFIHFPKLAEDGDYLFEKLRPYLPEGVTREQAAKDLETIAHEVLANPVIEDFSIHR